MKRFRWQILFGAGLVALSVILYFIHYLIFGDWYQACFYLLGDIAFIPVNVLLVTLVINQLLSRREKGLIKNKLNMVIGAFFSEVGTDLLKIFSDMAPCAHGLGKELMAVTDWSAQDFAHISRQVRKCDCKISLQPEHLQELRDFFKGRRDFLLRLLENPNLLEHDAFTELLWAVFHLAEEINYRLDLKQLPDTDIEHLSNDAKRAYSLLVFEWLAYMKHLKGSYPYLFSLAMRTNPFNPDVQPEIT